MTEFGVKEMNGRASSLTEKEKKDKVWLQPGLEPFLQTLHSLHDKYTLSPPWTLSLLHLVLSLLPRRFPIATTVPLHTLIHHHLRVYQPNPVSKSITRATMSEDASSYPPIEPSNFDLIVLGTGLLESMIAAATSTNNKTVLHLDPNPFYGSQISLRFPLSPRSGLTEKNRDTQGSGSVCSGPVVADWPRLGPKERYRVLLSDAVSSQHAMLTTQLNDRVELRTAVANP
ncbi:rab escort protein 1-like isoform X2 [Fagus crenata]